MENPILPTLAVLALLASPATALAHAHLKAASPSPKSVLQSAPKEVAIDFTEDLEPKFSTIEVTDPTGARVDQGDVHVGADDARHLAVSLKPLQPGTYSVKWRATATYTHKTEGKFTFTVAP